MLSIITSNIDKSRLCKQEKKAADEVTTQCSYGKDSGNLTYDKMSNYDVMYIVTSSPLFGCGFTQVHIHNILPSLLALFCVSEFAALFSLGS